MNTAAKLPLSVAIITLNEQERLRDCLQSVLFAQEIVVVDSHSTDQTVAIAEEFGAKVFQEKWLGFGRQKQLAIDRCTNQWVFILDADERLAAGAAQEIGAIITGGSSPYRAFQLPRKNFFLGRWIKQAGWWPDYVIRLINTRHCRMNQNLVHEALEIDGQVGTLATPLLHHATRNLAHTMTKMNRYSSAGAQELFARGETASYGRALARGAWAFFYNYALRGGFLDGGQGFIIAVSDAINKFFKYAKLVELIDRQKVKGERPWTSQ